MGKNKTDIDYLAEAWNEQNHSGFDPAEYSRVEPSALMDAVKTGVKDWKEHTPRVFPQDSDLRVLFLSGFLMGVGWERNRPK